jgi:hypothetical protein
MLVWCWWLWYCIFQISSEHFIREEHVMAYKTKTMVPYYVQLTIKVHAPIWYTQVPNESSVIYIRVHSPHQTHKTIVRRTNHIILHCTEVKLPQNQMNVHVLWDVTSFCTWIQTSGRTCMPLKMDAALSSEK